ncbi:MAG: HAD family hydrolase [Oscillospiraceae bacterium]|nr:HAD family hydrolase [Oscillospiraceae bacterium]
MRSNPEQTTLFFDYDGTLHDCIRIYAPSFRDVCKMLIKDGYDPGREFSDADISRWLGLSAPDMWNDFMPSLSDELKRDYGIKLGAGMTERILNGSARLYPGAKEMLSELKSCGFKMAFLSNCTREYMEAHTSAFGLDRWFDAFFCVEDFHDCQKWQIYEAVRDRFPGKHIIIGDRQKDIEIAEKFGLASVGCQYGYGAPGELSGCTFIAEKISDIAEIIKNMI